MTGSLKKCWAACVLGIALVTVHAQAHCADFPSKPVVLVVAGAPGGGTDAIARLLAAEISAPLGHSVIVENRAGAGGIIGTKSVASATADGHTLLMGHVATNAIVPILVKPRPYDPIADFAPVSMVGTAPDLLVVSAKSGIRSLSDLLARGRAGERLSYGSPGVGLPQHIAGYALAQAAGLEMQHVPYRGSAPALVDLLGGQLSMMFVTPGAAVPYLKSGQLKALAVTSPARSRFFPDIPTVRELGFPTVEETGWFGIFAPAKTPPAYVQRLAQHIGDAMKKAELRARLEGLYLEPSVDASPAAFATFVQAEVRQWTDTVQRLGVRAE
jgi:tripartite-type tricarboxylate transporter receptor subunit TctC